MTSTINGRQRAAGFKKSTPVCCNCVHEQRETNPQTKRTDRSCGLHGWFVLMSGTCTKHEYRNRSTQHAPAQP